ncbi:hypothetical protein U1Q18_030818 [Sarracenia purpurea var. burkii]
MVKDNSLFTCAFLLALVLSYGVWSSEERQVKTDSLPETQANKLPCFFIWCTPPGYRADDSKIAGEKAFPPTTPGRSPSIGSYPPTQLGSVED